MGGGRNHLAGTVGGPQGLRAADDLKENRSPQSCYHKELMSTKNHVSSKEDFKSQIGCSLANNLTSAS